MLPRPCLLMQGLSFKNKAQTIKAAILLTGLSLAYQACTTSRSTLAENSGDTTKSVVEGAPQVQSPNAAHILFDSSSYHFGSVKQGGVVYRELHFTNDGSADLDIQLISACECTQLEWPQLPLKPGARGVIKVRYDSKDKSGPQIVDVEILANTTPEMSYTKFFIFVEP